MYEYNFLIPIALTQMRSLCGDVTHDDADDAQSSCILLWLCLEFECQKTSH